ncbi:MAG: alkaline phosphatase family protein [Spirochaetaceae bacterium]
MTLEDATAGDELLHPIHPTIPNTVDLVRALRLISGDPGVLDEDDVSNHVLPLARQLGSVEHLVVVVADGLGLGMLEHLPGESSLRRFLVRELRAVYPSTTAVALTTIAAASWPYRHGITGWWTHLPEIGRTVAILPFVERGSGRPFHAYASSAGEIIRVRTAWQSSLRDVAVIIPPQIKPGSYNSWFHQGVRRVRRKPIGGVAKTVGRLVRRGKGPTLSYVYLPEVDHAAHHHGPDAAETEAAVAAIEKVVDELRCRLPPESRIIVTADHGHISTPRDKETVVGPDHELMTLLTAPPSGDVRSIQFFVKPHYRREFPERFRELLGTERFLLGSTDELIQTKMLGPGVPDDAVRSRWGDFTAIARNHNSFEFVPAGDRPKAFVGSHSGLSPEEMRVPLIVF